MLFYIATNDQWVIFIVYISVDFIIAMKEAMLIIKEKRKTVQESFHFQNIIVLSAVKEENKDN